MQKKTTLSRRKFLRHSFVGVAALSVAPFIDVWAAERQQVAKWAKEASLYEFHMIGHGHIDAVWLWPWSEGLSVVMSTFQAALDRMNEHPDFKFTASSALFYQWAAEHDPIMFAQIKQRIEEGRWEVAGGWWVEPDVNMPHGEALVRHGLYGQLTFERLVGRRAITGFNADSFGHPNTLPQIYRLQGMQHYVFMRPMAHEKSLPSDLFWWQGPDGTKMLTYRIQVGYSNSREIRPRIERMINERPNQPMQRFLSFYGAGDHGGGATQDNFRGIAEIQQQKGAPRLIYSTLDRYFTQMRAEPMFDLPIHQGDLLMHAVGCYTAEWEIKKNNRRAEADLLIAEKLAAIGSVIWGAHYPMQELTKAWQKVLFLQFHDSLAGTSLPEHSQTARDGYGRAMDIAQECTYSALQRLEWKIPSEDPDSEYLVVFNPHAWEVNPIVSYDINRKGAYYPEDEMGTALPFQWTLASTHTEQMKKLLFQVTLPPMGYRQIRVRPGEWPEQQLELVVGSQTLENKWLRVSFSLAGTIGIVDKTSGKEIFAGGQTGCRGVVLKDTSDTWSHDVVAFTEEIGAFDNASIKVLEEGPLRGMIRTTTTYGNSRLTIDWVLYAGARQLEANVILDWHERHKMLKFSFPVHLDTSAEATYETPYGYIDRSTTGAEEPGLRWINLTGQQGTAAMGLTLINDAKYGYSVKENDMRITVARSAVFGHHQPNLLDPSKEYLWMDQGLQTFRMLIVPHSSDWRNVDIPRKAEEFIAPPIAIYQGIHGGTLPKAASFLSLEAPGIILTAIKRAEQGEDLILRCVETWGQSTSAQLTLGWLDQQWSGDFTPFEIKSLRIDPKEGSIEEVNLLEEVM